MVSGIPQGSDLGPLLSILFTAEKWKDLENKTILFADDTTLYAKFASSSNCIYAAYSLKRDIFKIQLWCSTWEMNLSPRKHTQSL